MIANCVAFTTGRIRRSWKVERCFPSKVYSEAFHTIHVRDAATRGDTRHKKTITTVPARAMVARQREGDREIDRSMQGGSDNFANVSLQKNDDFEEEKDDEYKEESDDGSNGRSSCRDKYAPNCLAVHASSSSSSSSNDNHLQVAVRPCQAVPRGARRGRGILSECMAVRGGFFARFRVL